MLYLLSCVDMISRSLRLVTCSLLAGWASRAGHKVRILFDVVHIGHEHLELILSLNSIGSCRRGHCPGVERGHFRLECGNPLILRRAHWLLGCQQAKRDQKVRHQKHIHINCKAGAKLGAHRLAVFETAFNLPQLCITRNSLPWD